MTENYSLPEDVILAESFFINANSQCEQISPVMTINYGFYYYELAVTSSDFFYDVNANAIFECSNSYSGPWTLVNNFSGGWALSGANVGLNGPTTQTASGNDYFQFLRLRLEPADNTLPGTWSGVNLMVETTIDANVGPPSLPPLFNETLLVNANSTSNQETVIFVPPGHYVWAFSASIPNSSGIIWDPAYESYSPVALVNFGNSTEGPWEQISSSVLSFSYPGDTPQTATANGVSYFKYAQIRLVTVNAGGSPIANQSGNWSNVTLSLTPVNS